MTTFKRCEFRDNTARFAGAVRINDIGSATFEDCMFFGNHGQNRGGAVVTQIEKPDEQFAKLTNCLFCFNSSPEVRVLTDRGVVIRVVGRVRKGCVGATSEPAMMVFQCLWRGMPAAHDSHHDCSC